jgi:hypothetical protein
MPVRSPLMDIRMRDGSRHFLVLRETAGVEEIRARLEAIPGIRICDIVEGGFEWRMTFQCMGWHFSINNPLGELRVFADNPDCPDDILRCLGARLSDALS